MTFRDLFTLFDQWNHLNRAPRTAEFYAGQLDRLLDLYGSIEADQIRPQHLLPFKATWHLVLAVQRLYRWAITHDLIAASPILRLKRPRLGRRQRVLSRIEIARLMRDSAADFRDVLLCYRESAVRPLEVRELEWTALTIPERVSMAEALRSGQACFVLTTFKGRKMRAGDTSVRTIPITPRLGRLLLRLIERGPGNSVIFRSARGRPWSYSALRCRMRVLRKRSGLPLVVGGEMVCQYTLRHSTATQWVADGMQLNVCSTLLGHSRVTTTQRYIHLTRNQLLEEWRRHQERSRS
jgi:site-specific recombinase XerD